MEEPFDVQPDVSVIIPSRNGSKTIEKQLRSILSQSTDARFEIVVADNGSIDSTRDVVNAFQLENVSCIDAGRAPGINVARNEGIRASKGKLILLCDDDDQVHPGWIQAYWTSNWRHSLLSGSLDLVDGNGRKQGEIRGPYRISVHVPPHAVGSNCGFDRRVFDVVGGFDEGIAGGSDETDFYWRAADAGFDTYYVPEARILYRLRSGTQRIFKQGKSYGRGYELLMARHPQRVKFVGYTNLALLKMMARGCIGVFRTAPYERYSAIRKIGFSYGALAHRLRHHFFLSPSSRRQVS